MKIVSGFILMMTGFLSVGCEGYAYEKNLNGHYYLNAFDDYEEMVIGVHYDGTSGVGVIPATVFAIGQNDEFIIAKQHPLDEIRNIDKSTTNYFIIPLEQRVFKSIDSNYFGPLSLNEFNLKRHEPGIEAMPFTIVFKELK